MNDMKGKKVLVVGLGISGLSAAWFLKLQGADVVGVDRNAGLLEENQEIIKLQQLGVKVLSEMEVDSGFSNNFDLVVMSPGIAPDNRLYTDAVRNKIEIIGEVELACRNIRKQPFVGITGTNGKTTVTMLVGHILNFNGMAAKVLGNIGVPLTQEITTLKNEIVVCELSSYQLETMQTPVMDAAVLLNITPDHLDRYKKMEDYAMAKLRIGNCLKPGGVLYIENSCYQTYGHLLNKLGVSENLVKTFGYSPDCEIYTDLKAIYYKENIEFILPLQYRDRASHDLENIMAAYALCRKIGIDPDGFGRALNVFQKPPHRIEFVRTIGGVSYFDDSKGTNIDAVIRAVEAMKGQVILIAGGLDKGSSYSPWISAFRDKVSAICVIGQAKEKIAEELSNKFNVVRCQTLEEAVLISTTLAKEGDNVLLSPGCASFDMFKDYAHRGDEFKRIVNNLYKKQGELK